MNGLLIEYTDDIVCKWKWGFYLSMIMHEQRVALT